ncbi:MAG: hypothetical protein JWN30_2345 [Bacilli bacterium]|nr:hypothetical protein [Bacilli bacterium]
MSSYRTILNSVKDGLLSVEDALADLQKSSIEELGFATIDHDRVRRKGFSEVVYCAGKTPEQSATILKKLAERGDCNVLGTRAEAKVHELLLPDIPEAQYDPVSRAVYIYRGEQRREGAVLVAAAGTSDLPVAEEAALTAELMGNRVDRLYDVGVAGLHRLLRQLDRLYAARVIVVVAGMEGALTSVIAGLVNIPVIGVPTSVGYGAQLQGLAPLLGMLTTCAPGVSVVNIDNGFGAGYLASMINQLGERKCQ